MSYQTAVKGTFTRWNYDKTMLLIENFERLPQLWNTSLKDYRDRKKRAEAMTQLSLIVAMDETEVSRKLHNLRCQLNSEMRKIKQKQSDQGAEEVCESKWEYFAPLRFLIAESKLNETTSSLRDNNYQRSSERSCDMTSWKYANDDGTPLEWARMGKLLQLLFLRDHSSARSKSLPLTDAAIENSSKSNQSFSKTTPNFTETTNNLEGYNSTCFKRKRTMKHLSRRKQSKRAHKLKSEKNTVLQRALCLVEKCTDDCQVFADFIASRLRKLNDAKREELQRSIQLQILQAEAEESIASNHNENRASSAPMFRNFSDVSHN